MHTRDQLFIGNEWVRPSTDNTIDVISPTSEDVFARVPDASPEDIDRAVASSRDAFDNGPWSNTPPAERADAILRLSQALRDNAQEIADTITQENGSPAKQSLMMQVIGATAILNTYAEIARTFDFDSERIGFRKQKVRVRRAPVGVTAGIVPWNVPMYLAAMKLGPCLASGSTMVLKPAPETAFDPYFLAQAVLDAELPPGVVNIVAASTAGSEHLVRHPGIDKVSFTGSTATGARVGAICGEQIKRCTLELGGKSAAILLDDVDLDDRLDDILNSGLVNNGQVCAAQTRLLAPRSRYREIVDALGDKMSSMTVGDPMSPATDIGPVVARRQRDKILGMLDAARSEGARVAVGGGAPVGMNQGWFIAPTLFVDVDNSMSIARDEVFGPVLAVIPYDSDDEAVAIANDSDYGLSGSVWTTDLERGAALAARVRTGTVALNTSAMIDFLSPFGGFKKSGIGRELGPEGLAAYTEYQSIIYPAPPKGSRS